MTTTRTIVSAVDPFMAEGDFRVNLKVWFEELDGPVDFVAHPMDTEAHGRELWVRALAGEYGPVRVLRLEELPKDMALALLSERGRAGLIDDRKS